MTKKKKLAIYLFSLAILLFFAFFIYYYRSKIGQIIVPFFLALIIAYLINPMVKKLEKRKMPRMASILLIYILFFIFAAAITIFIIPELINNTRELMNTLPDITNRYQSMVNGIMAHIRSSSWPTDIKNTLSREVQLGAEMGQNYIAEILKKSLMSMIGMVAGFFDLILSMIIAYYLIKDSEFFKASVLNLIPRRWRNGLIGTGREISTVLAGFIQGQLLTALIVGTMETVGLLIVKVKYPVVLGLIGGLANIIPYFGPIIGAIPAVILALIESPSKAIWTILVFVIIQQIDNAFISPKIIEGRLGLHPVTTILAVLVGGEFFGILGMLVSVPITAVLKIIIKRVIETIVRRPEST